MNPFPAMILRTLFWRPSDAFAALFWLATGRRVRARNRLRMAVGQAPFAYDMWIATTERSAGPADPARACAALPARPRLSVILHDRPGMPARDRARTIASLEAQTYPEWELVVVGRDGGAAPNVRAPQVKLIAARTDDPAIALPLGIEAATGEFVLPLPEGAVLPPSALFRYAEALQNAPDATVLFADHDRINARGKRSDAWFKPRWNAEMFLAQDYIAPACAIRSKAARAALPLDGAEGEASCYALLLAVTAQPDARIEHVPHVLCHLTGAAEPDTQAMRLRVVARHVAAAGGQALAGPFGTVAVAWPLPDPLPLVSIIVPTRDRVDLLRACIDGLLTATRYSAREVIIVDNGSVDPKTLNYLREVARHPQVRVLRYAQPWNFSAINNFAVRHAKGAYLCLLNNDTEVLDEQWLTEMMRHAVRPEVGAVGARLEYDDGSIQHAGVVVGMGGAAGHAHRFLRAGQPGYFHRPHIAHFVTAVTAACLVVAREKFDAVGGFDEQGLAVAFNDVDLCLKLERAGWRNVYTPRAVLAHHESQSRGKDSAPRNLARYKAELAVLRDRWGTETFVDPLHHPHLDRSSETFIIGL